jgi:hypothetical protein
LRERTQFRAAPNEAKSGAPNEAKFAGAQERGDILGDFAEREGNLAVWIGRGADFGATGDGLRCVFDVSFLRFSNYFEAAGASRPAPTVLWNRFQCMQRFLARKKE